MSHGRMSPCPAPAKEIQYQFTVGNTILGRIVLLIGILYATILVARYFVWSLTLAAVRNIFLGRLILLV